MIGYHTIDNIVMFTSLTITGYCAIAMLVESYRHKKFFEKDKEWLNNETAKWENFEPEYEKLKSETESKLQELKDAVAGFEGTVSKLEDTIKELGIINQKLEEIK